MYNFLNRENDRKLDAKPDENVEAMNLKWFGKLFGRRFSTIFSTNLLFVLGNFPIFFIMVILSGMINDHSLVPQTVSFSNLYGATAAGGYDPLTAVYYGVSGAPVMENEYKMVLLGLFIGLSCLIFLTFGLVNCGCAHIMRSVIRREPVFLFKDFFNTIRKNLKQGLALGIFDLLFTVVILYDIWLFYLNYAYSFFYTVAFFFSIGVLLIYLFARMYMYMLCITFDLKFFKLIKNSVIFAFLGFKRNIMALLGQGIIWYIFLVCMMNGVTMALGALLPLIILFGLGMFMSYFASYKVIKRYMIDPYYDENGNPI